MFGILEDVVENTLDVFDGLVDGELPTKRQVSKLVADGVEIAAIAAATGYSVEVIASLLDD